MLKLQIPIEHALCSMAIDGNRIANHSSRPTTVHVDQAIQRVNSYLVQVKTLTGHKPRFPDSKLSWPALWQHYGVQRLNKVLVKLNSPRGRATSTKNKRRRISRINRACTSMKWNFVLCNWFSRRSPGSSDCDERSFSSIICLPDTRYTRIVRRNIGRWLCAVQSIPTVNGGF